MKSSRPLILASRSPRRSFLLSALGVSFSVLRVGEAEISPPLRPEKLTCFLAWRKATLALQRLRASRRLRAARRTGQGVIVAADTGVFLDSRSYGKPASAAEARRQLAGLSGRTHRVVTGLAVIDARTGAGVTASASSSVTLRRLKKAEIDSYVAGGEPFGKAGSYAIQGRGASIIKALKGDYFNVVGFPVRLFAALIARFGIRVSPSRIARLYRSVPRFPRG